MGMVRLHQTSQLLTAHRGAGGIPTGTFEPGDLVSDVYEKNTLGTVISVCNGVATVVWSKGPAELTIVSTPIIAKARKLKATWSIETLADNVAYYSIDAERELLKSAIGEAR